MDSKERLITREYTCEQLPALEQFCSKCEIAGYKNNSSIEAMRLDWCLKEGGQFFLTYLDNIIISVSGCHPLPQAGPDCYRILFRGATLPEYQNFFKIVSKTHMSSIPFFSHIPLQVEWAKGFTKHVVTTNWSNPDGIVSMGHSHRVFQLLNRQGLVSCLIEKINLFYTDQSVWQINLEKYFKARTEFKDRNGLY